ncbi:MAG: hypothetical protein ACFB0Z_04060 [Candidatus Phaeomarinobacter sp.]
MKAIFTVSLSALALLLATGSKQALALQSCSYQGLELFGEVAVVSANADIKVEVVPSGADLKVQWVNQHADRCGEWRRVGLGADFTIQLVPAGGDIKIQEVTRNPGLL